MTEQIFDVVLQSNAPFGYSPVNWQITAPPEPDFFLEPDFWIGKLPHNVDSDRVFDACQPAGFRFRPLRTYACRYAFCRRVTPVPERYFNWDEDSRLSRTLFLSRLIHPTTISSHHSARLIFENGELTTIVPGRVQGYATHAWVVAKEWRDWLSRAEAEQLRRDLANYNLQPPERVRRARSHIDHAFHSFYFDQKTSSIVSSYETLLKVERNRATAQFRLRVPALAQMFGVSITAGEADAFYDDRSVFVHGRTPNYRDVSDEVMERYNRFEGALRHALLRASTDNAFAASFADDASVIGTFRSL